MRKPMKGWWRSPYIFGCLRNYKHEKGRLKGARVKWKPKKT
jgi:hypothetical protein